MANSKNDVGSKKKIVKTSENTAYIQQVLAHSCKIYMTYLSVSSFRKIINIQ